MLDGKIGVLLDVIYMRAGSWFAAESTQPSHCVLTTCEMNQREKKYI